MSVAASEEPSTKRIATAPYRGDLPPETFTPSISVDGGRVAFVSCADFPLLGDVNETCDAFVYSTSTEQLTHVSKGPNDEKGSLDVIGAGISPDGGHVAFVTASSLEIGDTDQANDVYLRDLSANETARVELPGGATTIRISDGARYLTYWRKTSNDFAALHQTYRYDRVTNQEVMVSVDDAGAPADESAFPIGISRSGNRVLLWSGAENLHNGDGGSSSTIDLFVRDVLKGKTLSVTSGHPFYTPESAELSEGGGFVAFETHHSFSGRDQNLPNDYQYPTSGRDVYVYDIAKDAYELASVSSAGEYIDGRASAVGNTDLLAVSPTGRFLLLYSRSDEYVPFDNNNVEDIFVRDRRTGMTRTLVSTESTHRQPEENRRYEPWADIDGAGRFSVFESDSPDLVGADDGESYDLFVTGPKSHPVRPRFPKGLRAFFRPYEIDEDYAKRVYGAIRLENETKADLTVQCRLAALSNEMDDVVPRNPKLDNVIGAASIKKRVPAGRTVRARFDFPTYGWFSYFRVMWCYRVAGE